MNRLLIFIVRLILGLVFGILLTRLFHPEWGIIRGGALGLILVALAYGLHSYKTSKARRKG